MNKQEIEAYAQKYIKTLDQTPGREMSIAEGDDMWTVTFKDGDDRPIRGGIVVYIHNDTGDVFDITRFGSGAGLGVLLNVIEKFYHDTDFRELLRLSGVIVGNVKKGVFNG